MKNNPGDKANSGSFERWISRVRPQAFSSPHPGGSGAFLTWKFELRETVAFYTALTTSMTTQGIFAARNGDDIYLIQEGSMWPAAGEPHPDRHHERLIVWKWDATGRGFERTGMYTTRARYYWQEGGSAWKPMNVAWQPVAARRHRSDRKRIRK